LKFFLSVAGEQPALRFGGVHEVHRTKTHSAQRWLIKTKRFTTALETESPVSREISEFTPCTHAQSNVLYVNYAEKTDD